MASIVTSHELTKSTIMDSGYFPLYLEYDSHNENLHLKARLLSSAADTTNVKISAVENTYTHERVLCCRDVLIRAPGMSNIICESNVIRLLVQFS